MLGHSRLIFPQNDQCIVKEETMDGIDIKVKTEVLISDMEFEDDDEEEQEEISESALLENAGIGDQSVSEMFSSMLEDIEKDKLQLQGDSSSVHVASPQSEKYSKLIKSKGVSNTCKVCFFKHQSMKVMQQHCKQHIQSDQGENCSYILCNLCDRRYKHLCHFYKHRNLIHVKKYEYSCGECDKTFRSMDSLRVHVKYLHQGFGRYRENPETRVCSICRQRFRRPNSLARHMQEVHEGIKYTCALCNKLFTQKASVKKHLFSVHFKDDRLICITCGKSFTVRSSLLRHIERKHKKKYFCNYCMSGFEGKNMLIKHFKESH
ncbi:zinc finger protein 416 [Nilaparvata lugens]|uniref:zinc finger protein 416 n=1 Tax=Nilaparvata lugens TaxID=108931 RepID=UPI00193DDE97|nr:zinc finger protein 416 [Nilaparvata lugens]